MGKERLATYIATAFDASLADAAGEALELDLQLPLGQGARILWAQPVNFFSLLGVTSGSIIGLSLDPSESTPASLQAVHQNLSVIMTWSYSVGLLTSGARMLYGAHVVDLSQYNILLARSLSVQAFNDSGSTIVNWGMRIGYRLVELSDSDLSDVLARQR